MNYTAVIRTLGKSGEKYQILLNSLNKQTIQPSKILVYIAENCALPRETIGKEQYVYVKKGMVAQRALLYDEVDTEYILFLDDDLSFPENTVENMFKLMLQEGADVISPDIYPNANRPFWAEMMMWLSGRMCARRHDNYWGYKVMRNAGYSYNASVLKDVYWSQTNAGACFLCSKKNFLKISFEQELWLDQVGYPVGEDQVMYYKMYLLGLKILTWYSHGFVHLDGGENMQLEKKKKVIYSDFRFKTIFWHRFIYLPEKSKLMRIWSIFCICYTFFFGLIVSLFKARFDIVKIKYMAIRDGIVFLNSNAYNVLPTINKIV
ncbi:glycosyltransferase [Phocaeicola plebeius]|jgi:GT2 family glycosyltransferase|uniref:glycosyltransferase n=1 Tax=Phocaeicola plebeius TaxID=310297 RepID=UPI0026F0BE3F|nr:glycosyltransferase [Phocaeicola plebeius]